MNRKYLIWLAFKNLRMRFLRTLLTLAGIAIGIAAIVFLAAFTFGLENLVTKSIGGDEAYTLLDVGTGNSQIVKINDETIKKIRAIQNVASIEESVSFPAKAKINDNSVDVSFYGASAKYLNWSGVKLEAGRVLPADGNSVIISTALLKVLGGGEENIGKTLKFDLIIPKELSGDESLSVLDQPYEIVGIAKDDTGAKVWTNNTSLQAVGLKNFSQLKIELKDKDKVGEVRSLIENIGLNTQYIGDTVSEIESVFGVFRLILISFGLLALIVAVLGMFNTLTISLMERIREVALLKVFGIQTKDLRMIFYFEASLFGILGGLLGISFGLLLGRVANSIVGHYALSAGGESVKLFYYPVGFIVLIFAFSFLVGFLTGLYPAKKAVKVDTLDVLRYE